MFPALSFIATTKQTCVLSAIGFVPSSLLVSISVNVQLITVSLFVALTGFQPSVPSAAITVLAAGAEGSVLPS